MTPEEWSRAACATPEHRDLFVYDVEDVGGMAGVRRVVRAAKEVCAGCPIVQGCLEHALKNFHHGVWGGMTRRERDILRKDRREAAAS